MKDFHERLLALELTAKEIACILGCNRSTAKRWLKGTHEPHGSMKGFVLGYLEQEKNLDENGKVAQPGRASG